MRRYDDIDDFFDDIEYLFGEPNRAHSLDRWDQVPTRLSTNAFESDFDLAAPSHPPRKSKSDDPLAQLVGVTRARNRGLGRKRRPGSKLIQSIHGSQVRERHARTLVPSTAINNFNNASSRVRDAIRNLTEAVRSRESGRIASARTNLYNRLREFTRASRDLDETDPALYQQQSGRIGELIATARAAVRASR